MAKTKLLLTDISIIFFLLLIFSVANKAVCASQARAQLKLGETPSPRTALDLKDVPFRIVYETYRETDGRRNWELYLVNADGSNPVNLTRTPDVDELYPHASSDGAKICFVADEVVEKKKTRNVYYINIDGSGRVKVADNARQPCWSPDSKKIAYLKGEFDRYTITDYATKGLFFYDIETRKHTQHPNTNLHHLYNICWSPDGKWFLATVHGGMGFNHANLAFQTNEDKVFDLTKYAVTGCRPDWSFDGKRITWGLSDWDLCVANIDTSSGVPSVTDVRRIMTCGKEDEVYHSDFSPDAKYIAFSHGPKADEMVGGKAPGWNICVSDMTGKWVKVTTDGNHNKEPDWVSPRTPNR
jgi:Tol biopolymer transport system component